jgi:UDP-N-acetylmuramyl pentapeptide phosphotransferase/UDP-N-acetylglucosamine-1-phosphate transferase
MANAVNLIDGLDGLASGITLFGLLAVSVVGYLGELLVLLGCLLF